MPELIAWKVEAAQDAEAAGSLTREEREFLMNTHEIYEQWRKQAEEAGRRKGQREGKREGQQEGLREGVVRGLQQGLLAAYEARFGAVPAVLAAAIEAQQESEILRRWFPLISTGSSEEISTHIVGQKPPPRAPR